jgi:hypothetical protein
MEAVVVSGRKILYPDLASSALTQAGRVFGRVFGCWHLNLSRPFTRDGETYRACLACGARRRFDTERWKTLGRFYYPAHPA